MNKSYILINSKIISNRISPYTTGACIEDVNHEIYGGIYSQMIFGESFEEEPMEIKSNIKQFFGLSGTISCKAERSFLKDKSDIRTWQPFSKGEAKGCFIIEKEITFNGEQSQKIIFLSGKGEIGIENQGLNRWGMYFKKEELYEGYIWIFVEKPLEFYISFEDKDGLIVYAEKKLQAKGNDWEKLCFTLKPKATDKKGRFSIKLKQEGSILVGHVFLQPGSWGRYKGLPVRKDIVKGLIKEGLTSLRYGGSMINASEYRWKKMIGPRDKRQPYQGGWYKYSTNGWGIIDFIDLCEAVGFECVPAFNIEETPSDMADFVEYVNGNIDTKWGKKRSESGHPKPYNLKYIEIGNEQMITDYYWKKFKPVAEAIWKKSEDIIIIVGDWLAYPITDPYSLNWPYIKTLKVHKKILDLAKARNRPVWFDIHIWEDKPRRDCPDIFTGLKGIKDYLYWLNEISKDPNFKLVVLEENANNHTLRRALDHALILNELQRAGHEIMIVCAANCLQPYEQNDNGWDQGFLFFNSSKVWGQPPYYVTQMISHNYLPLCVKAEFSSPNNALDVTARKSEDGKILTLQVLNLKNVDLETNITINDFTPMQSTAKLTEISGKLEEKNSPENPEKIIPKEREWNFKINNGILTYIFPAQSFTIIRFT
jgi:alpha-L-arabinofuranosidase